MNADQKQRAAELLSAWRATAYALHADRMADLLQELVDAPTPKPFGYFKAEPFGWTDCAETDDGAIALFAAPPAPSVPDELSGRFTDPTKLAVDLPTWENGDAPLVGGGLISRGVVDFATVGIWPTKPAPSVPDGWIRAVDEAMVVHHIGIADRADSYEVAKKKLNALLAINSDIERHFSEPPADVARDAERYRFLRKKICFSGNGDGTASMHAINLPDAARFPEYDNLEIGVDAAIDAAIDREILGGGNG